MKLSPLLQSLDLTALLAVLRMRSVNTWVRKAPTLVVEADL